MVTDLAEVFRLGTSKAKENLAFRRYLSAHHYPESAFQILASEVARHIDCTQCGNCCRESVVAVGQTEIERIARYLGVTNETVAALYTAPDPECSSRRVLRNSPDGCVFLDGNLCLIYEARPTTCREFPYLSAGRRTLGARPCSHGRWASRCPIIFNALEDFKRLTGYKRP